jgi:hypothetical protein
VITRLVLALSLVSALTGCLTPGSVSPSDVSGNTATPGATASGTLGLGSGEAEAAPDLANPKVCTDAAIGYTLSFPGNWFTNNQDASGPSCRAFSDVGPFGVPDEIPAYVRVWILPQDDEPGDPIGLISEDLRTVSGYSALRREVVLDDAGGLLLLYIISLGSTSNPRYLVAATSTEQVGNFATNIAVLDWMMGLIEIGPRQT